MSATVSTARAEEACELLFRTLAAHRDAVAGLTMRVASRRIPVVGTDPEQLQCQATLVRLLSITESFCSERLLNELESAVDPDRHDVVAQIWNSAYDAATSTWEKQQVHYNKWLGVNLGAAWTPIKDIAATRNAVAHGHGFLTQRQRRDRGDMKSKLTPHQITLDGDRIVLSDSALAGVTATCRKFIETLDLAVQNR